MSATAVALAADAPPGSLLAVHGLSKRFGGLAAVDGADFEVPRGGIVGLIGPNGAGKTTIFNLITGNHRPDAGEVLLDGRSLVGLPTHRIVALGVARTFQNIRLFGQLTAIENVLAGRHCRTRAGLLGGLLSLPAARREERAAVARARDELAFVGLAGRALDQARNLAYGDQRRLEIARALATDPSLLVLDEPAGGMNEAETDELLELVAGIRARGVTVLLIEHDMRLVMRACERLVVLERGRVIARGTPLEVQGDARVIEAYLGTEEE